MSDLGPAVVVGSGRTVWDDLRAIDLPDAVTFGVNDMIMFSPRLDHGVSHHHAKLPHWIALRPQPTKNVRLHATGGQGMVGWPDFRGTGSSSLLAVRIARALGHDPVFVAGVPLDNRGYVWEDPTLEKSKDFANFRGGWTRRAGELRGHVYSPSGFLRDLLGWAR